MIENQHHLISIRSILTLSLGIIIGLLLCLILIIVTGRYKPLITPITPTPVPDSILSKQIHIFYYPWYGNPEFDRRKPGTNSEGWRHWQQNVQGSPRFPPKDLGSNFYPLLGAYSSSDPKTVSQHMKWIAQTDIGVVVMSWSGQGSWSDERTLLVLDSALEQGLEVAFLLEPYKGSTPESIKADINYIYHEYGYHKAFHRVSHSTSYGPSNRPRGVFYVFNPLAIGSWEDWQVMLDSIRKQADDAFFVAQRLSDKPIIQGHFDGVFTYDTYAVDGDSFAALNKTIIESGGVFAPSVGPGYDETRAISGSDRQKSREDGKRYDSMWQHAIDSGSQWVTVTSFNEWHEGTQIEPATNEQDIYLSYEGAYGKSGTAARSAYLDRTKDWANIFKDTSEFRNMSLAISPSNPTITPEKNQDFTFEILGQEEQGYTPIWEVTGGTITGKGSTISYKAPNRPGTYTLTAMIVNKKNISKSVEASIIVTDTNAKVLEVAIGSSHDDAEEGPDGKVLLDSSGLELVYDKGSQVVGQRFAGINIPQGTVISNAYIQFTTHEKSSANEASLIIRGEDTNDSFPFIKTTYNIASRPTTKASVSWSPERWEAVGDSISTQRTPNIAPVIQEIIDRPDWSEGNALTILLTGRGKRVAKSYDSDANQAPILHIEYNQSVSIDSFTVDSYSVQPNQEITFSWSASEAWNSPLSCQLDVDGDNSADYSIGDCKSTTSQKHTYTNVGYYAAKLMVTNDMNISANATTTITVTHPDSVTIAAVGDISCDPLSNWFNSGQGTDKYCHMEAVTRQIEAINPIAFLPLGDIQYENGELWKFEESYDLSYGRLKDITYPAVGNHEYLTPGAAGYFAYFGEAAGDPSKGYYSYDLGNWHLIALNSNCRDLVDDGCRVGTAQEKWLREDLAANHSTCTIAYWHHPRFSSGKHGNNISYIDFWNALYEAGAEIVLVGHDHHYERFAPMKSNGEIDEERGLREFLVGGGGKNLTDIFTVISSSEFRNAEDYGFLKLDLHPQAYDWEFISETGEILDSGSGNCHF